LISITVTRLVAPVPSPPACGGKGQGEGGQTPARKLDVSGNGENPWVRTALATTAWALLVVSSLARPPFYDDKSNLLVYRDAAGAAHPVTTAEQWAKRRAHILANMQEVMGQLPETSRVPLEVRVTEEIRTEHFTRKKLTYVAEPGDRVPAYLFVPRQAAAQSPAVLCLHQTTPRGKAEPAGMGPSSDMHYALELANRGYVVLAPDYPSFGEYPYDFRTGRYQSGTMKALWNNIRAIDLLQSLPQVNAERIGCIGHSLGGHNALFTAAFDTRLKAVVSNCGFTSFTKYYGGNLKGWTSDRYMPRIATTYGSKPKAMPFDFSEVAAALAPRAFLAIAPVHDDNFEVSGVRDVISAAAPVFDLLGGKQKLMARYPDCAHSFPSESRKTAYKWLDRWLR
jgi:dienelactone hydrolase